MILTLQCYRCGTAYDYIGDSPHPAQCQACGSSCVPPAGSVTVVDRVRWESANGLSKVWVKAVDDRDRPFEFEVVAHGRRGKLSALKVDGVSVDPQIDETLEALPPAVTVELADIGVTEIATGAIGHSKQ